MTESVLKLNNLYRHISHLAHLDAMLKWDEAVMMPSGGTEARADALAELAVLLHSKYCAPEVEDLVGRAEADLAQAPVDSIDRLNLAEFKRSLVQHRAFPKEFVERQTKAQILSESAWRKLRPLNDWKAFRPHLVELLSLAKEASQMLSDKTGAAPYDSLIQLYNPDLGQKDIDPVFKDLMSWLPATIQEVVEKSKAQNFKKIQGTFRRDRQKALGLKIMEIMGFSFQNGRLDESHHPFCGGVPSDVRITTRYSDSEFTQSLMGIIHETGHGLYEQNLPKAWSGQPVGRARGMAMHESQSLFWEMQVAQSEEFFELIRPHIVEYLSESSNVAELSHGDLFRNIARVQPSFIRVDADEVTYPCHVILRYEIEKSLFAGDLTVDDIPAIWNEKMQKYLGLSTEGNYKDGCLQDVHWPAGIFGYFPSYTLGALIAAQYFAKLESQLPKVREQIRKGQLGQLRLWLDQNVWSKASSQSHQQIIRGATGKDLSTEAYRLHIRRRYL